MQLPLDRALGFWLNRSFNRLRAVSMRRLEAAGLDVSPEHWALIARLAEEDGLSQQQLGERTFRDGSVITRLVDGLARRGLVERRPDATDRRVHRLRLTDAGRALHAPLAACVEGIRDEAFAGLTEEEITITLRALQKIWSNLADDDA